MSDIGYVKLRMVDAIGALCKGNGTFEERLYHAWQPALASLCSSDPVAEVAEELNWVLLKCNQQLAGPGKMNPLREEDQFRIVEKLLHVLIESTKLKYRQDADI